VDTASGAVVGTEALLRWNHPGRGVVSPAEFIPLAEETGLIVPIGAWVLAEACRTTAPWARWAEQTGRPFHVSVNLSAVQLQDAELVDHVAACLRRNGMDAATLRLEITESVLFSERDASTSILRSLHDLGVGLVVDDFGTGYSSLAYLQRFPLRALKIDRSFTSKLGDDEHTSAIVEAITSMAAALDLETVAEGVEEEEQREVLVRLGCSHSQGWLFGRPVPAADFERVLRASAPGPRRSRNAPRRTPADARGQGVDEGAFRSLLDAVPDVVATFDRELRHVYVNAAAERAAGRTRAELLGRTNAELAMPAANVRQWDAAIRAVFITGRPLDIDFRHDGPQGTRWYSSRLVPEVVDGRVVSVSAITRDVTEEQVATSIAEPVLDARTGVLGRAAFLRLAGDLRHAHDDAFAVVVAAFDVDVPPGAGAALRAVVQAGDVTARWSASELVVLRHPAIGEDANALRAAVALALARFGADVDVRLSSSEAPTPADLLDHRTRLARLA
jgi:PAS domain S-box-containing protein